MRRFGLAVGLGSLLALAAPGVAGAAGPYDFVSGAIKRVGLSDSTDRHFILSAHNGPQGPNGQYTATYGKGKSAVGYKGTVTCVNVVGPLARVGIQITESSRSDVVVGSYEILRVTDYGNPSGDDQMDSLSPGVFTSVPANCAEPYEDPTPTYAGNFTVNDAG